jgi:glucan 1,3-beta-glucosidase
MVRLPIGDWTLAPYGPYVGCMDGAKEKIDWLLDTAAKYNIQVLMDVHTAKGSQNGFDNGGIAKRIEWKDDTHYTHIGEADWIGPWNTTTNKYEHVNYDHLAWTMHHSQLLL